MTKTEIVERLQYLGCPAVRGASVATIVRTYPKALLERWLEEADK